MSGAHALTVDHTHWFVGDTRTEKMISSFRRCRSLEMIERGLP